MNNDLDKILISEKELMKKVEDIATKISVDYLGKNPVLICILRGGVLFLSDLMKRITIPLEIDFLSLSSYGNSTESSGIVKIRKDIDSDIYERHVIIIEDIVDSGLTLKYIKDYFQKHKAASIKICTLLDKPKAHKIDIKIDYCGFEIGNEFVVGYGLDYAEKYRNLPYIGILKEEIYTNK